LNDGTVLLAGGFLGTDLASAELYNPTSGTFTLTGNLNTARWEHTATLLSNGDVLVVGGYNFTVGYLASAEIYVAPHQNVLLGSEYNNASNTTYEVYDDTPTLLHTGNLSNPLANHSATALKNGNIFVAGGSYDTTLWQIFAVSGGQLQLLSSGSLRDSRDSSFAVLLPNGNLLLGGGAISAGTWEIRNPAGALVSTGNLNGSRTSGASAVLLKDGNVWISGSTLGNGDACTWEIRSETGSLVSSGSLNTCFAGGKLQVLNNGDVILLGGDNAPGAYEIYTQTGTRVRTGSLINGFNHGASAVSLNQGAEVFIFGSCETGFDNPGDPYFVGSCPSGGAIGTWEFLGFDANANTTFDTTGSLFDSRSGARATVTSVGNIFITGGQFVPGTWEMWAPNGATVSQVGHGNLSDTRYAGHSLNHD
jgi:hypothetical protein